MQLISQFCVRISAYMLELIDTIAEIVDLSRYTSLGKTGILYRPNFILTTSLDNELYS